MSFVVSSHSHLKSREILEAEGVGGATQDNPLAVVESRTPESGRKIPIFTPNISRYPRNELNSVNANPYEYGVL
jgi:hypothetical protein